MNNDIDIDTYVCVDEAGDQQDFISVNSYSKTAVTGNMHQLDGFKPLHIQEVDQATFDQIIATPLDDKYVVMKATELSKEDRDDLNLRWAKDSAYIGERNAAGNESNAAEFFIYQYVDDRTLEAEDTPVELKGSSEYSTFRMVYGSECSFGTKYDYRDYRMFYYTPQGSVLNCDDFYVVYDRWGNDVGKVSDKVLFHHDSFKSSYGLETDLILSALDYFGIHYYSKDELKEYPNLRKVKGKDTFFHSGGKRPRLRPIELQASNERAAKRKKTFYRYLWAFIFVAVIKYHQYIWEGIQVIFYISIMSATPFFFGWGWFGGYGGHDDDDW